MLQKFCLILQIIGGLQCKRTRVRASSAEVSPTLFLGFANGPIEEGAHRKAAVHTNSNKYLPMDAP